MTTSSEIELLSWPGKGTPAVLTETGWTHVKVPEGFDFGFDPPMSSVLEPSHQALVLIGERLGCIRALRAVDIVPLTLAYLDFPRLSHAAFVREQLRVSTWLSALRSHVDSVAQLLSPGGRIVVHVDDAGAALAMAVLDDLLGQARREATILWQKKYGPQNDLKGRIDDAQDYLLVYGVGEEVPPSKLESSWWPWQYAGKSEDATREAEQLRDSGVITLPVIPKTSKPAKLVERLLDAYTMPGDYVLECFSDTGFASAATVRKGRRAILLAGETEVEREMMNRCSIPRLIDSAANEDSVAKFVLHPLAYTAAKVTAAGEAIELRTNSSSQPAREMRPILVQRGEADVVPSGRGGFPSMSVTGSVPDVLVALEPAVRCDVMLTIFDWRESRFSQGTELRLMAASRLLDAEGVVAVLVNHLDYAAIRLACELKVFGHSQYLGTAAVEQGDSPSLALLFKGLPAARLGKIGLEVEREFGGSDGDPRGPWRDPGHKGARSGSKNTAFEYRLPPYRWQLVKGQLPPGAWQLNPTSGVIWGPRLERAGVFRFTVRVTDSVGDYSELECSIEVKETGRPRYPDSVWWMDRPATPTEGAPRVTSPQLPGGVVGEPYCAILEADGGTPTQETTAPGEALEGGLRTRYWEFARESLVSAILEDRAYFGSTGRAKPRIKKYRNKADSQHTTKVELSWWDKRCLAGQSPEMRLVSLFTEPGDLVMVKGSESYVEILRSGRRCLLIGDDGPNDRFPFLGRLGDVVAVWDPDRRTFRPKYDSPDFESGIPWTLGFLPPETVFSRAALEDMVDLRGVTADPSEGMTILAPMEWPTRSRCEELARQCGKHFSRVHVLYYRGKPPRGVSPLRFRRIPFDFAGAL